jgi:hypothetical protein
VAIPQNSGFSAKQGTESRFSPGEGKFAGRNLLRKDLHTRKYFEKIIV